MGEPVEGVGIGEENGGEDEALDCFGMGLGIEQGEGAAPAGGHDGVPLLDVEMGADGLKIGEEM